ncbi:MAG: tRNA uracil 4-sulfurtransferase ThiI [Anaerovoracaceae bacterium]|jgi:thiamine biosynthesis protein ThiI|nr:tRNA uracil 4-sulfurtransferase ThiI [Bacillota bacterium]
MEMNTIIIRSGEIALKGLNKPYFERILVEKIKQHTKMFLSKGPIEIKRNQGLIFLKASKEIPLDELVYEISKVFGIASVSHAIEMERDMEVIGDAAVTYMKQLIKEKGIKTFKVEAKRSDKTYPVTSPEIARIIGAKILVGCKVLKVDVHHPDCLLYVDVRGDHAYIYEEKIAAQGGLPLGTNGRGMLLLSGGIDSPVAGFMMAKRGMAIEAVHYHSYPYTSKRAQQKVERLAKILCQYVGKMKVHTVNLLPAQEEIARVCPEDEMTLLVRRFMMRIAQDLSLEKDCGFLITGENLGQVASQTAEGLVVTDAAVNIPVLRPLIAFDKVDIIKKAQEIGTFETSIEPFEDCCTVFLPKHPSTRPKLEDILASEEKLDVVALTRVVMESRKVIEIKQ